jgi:hypothetical protein
MKEGAPIEHDPGVYSRPGLLVKEAERVVVALQRASELFWRQREGSPPGLSMAGIFGRAPSGTVLVPAVFPDAIGAALTEMGRHPLLESSELLLINRQGPYVKQYLHPDDGQENPVHIVQLSPEGRFNYIPVGQPETAPERPLDVTTGDVITLTDCQRMLHGGQNVGPDFRYNVVWHTSRA